MGFGTLKSLHTFEQLIKNTHREKAPSNKTPTLTKNINMDICVVGTSNQLFIWGFWAERKLSKKWNSYWQNSILCVLLHSLFCTPHLFVLTLASDRAVLRVLQFFGKNLPFWENLFQSYRIENVKNFQWLLHKNILISQT